MTRVCGLALALLAIACVENVELARVPIVSDASVAADMPSDVAFDSGNDTLPDITPADAPVDVALEAAMDAASDVRADVPDADVPDADVPDADVPDADVPDADVFDADVPDADVPDADVPDAGAPALTVVQAVMMVSSEGAGTRGLQTDTSITLTRGGTMVTSALVRLTSSLGPVALELTAGHFHGTQDGYASSYELTVVTFDERPPPQLWTSLPAHTFIAPRPAEMHAALTPLAVAWTPSGAMDAQFLSPAMLPVMTDIGTATLPGMHFPRELRTASVRLRRRMTTALPGFGPGSSVRVEVTAAVAITVN